MSDQEKYVNRSGWFGRRDQVVHYLMTVGADKTEDGKSFRIGGPGLAAFLGDTSDTADVAVTADTTYFVNGVEANLAYGLSQTSYGIGVIAIY